MSTLRKIVIQEKEYLWKYTFDDYDYENDSHLVIKDSNKDGKLIIYFRTGKWDFGYCPFNRGVPAIYHGEPVVINLNQPRFIAEIFAYVMNKLKKDSLIGTTEFNEGLEMLHDMGYEFEYEKKWDS